MKSIKTYSEVAISLCSDENHHLRIGVEIQ